MKSRRTPRFQKHARHLVGATQFTSAGTRPSVFLAAQRGTIYPRRSYEFLEPRLPLSGTYTGLGGFVGQEIANLQADFAETALKNPIPILETALSGVATASQNSLLQDYVTAANTLTKGGGDNATNDGATIASSFQTLFPSAQNGQGFTNTSVAFDTTTDLFHVVVTEVKPVSLSQFDVGLPALQFAGQTNFQVNVTLTLDLTIGGGNGNFFLDADGATSELQVGVSVDSSQLPSVTNVTLGPLSGQATPARASAH